MKLYALMIVLSILGAVVLAFFFALFLDKYTPSTYPKECIKLEANSK